MDLTTILVLLSAVVAVGAIAISQFVNVKVEAEPAAKKQKKQKLTKSEKVAARAAAQQSKKSTVAVEQEVEAAAAKAEKKRQKEKERKARRKAEDAAAKAEKVKADKAAAAAEAKQAAEETVSKKKKKKKGKKKHTEEASAPAVAAVPEVSATPEEDGWVTIEKKEKAAPVAVASDDKAQEFKEDLMIEQEHFRVVIGPKGSTLGKICEATNTQIKLPNKGFRDRTWISGTSQADVDRAKEALEQLCNKGYCDITAPGRMDDGIDIPKNFFGQIMGRGGATIALLQKETETDIKLPDRDSDSTFVKVLGESANVARALAALKDLKEKGYSSVTHPNWTSKTVQVPRDQLRNIIGEKGSVIREMEATSGCRIEIPSGSRADPCEVEIKGQLTGIEEAVLLITSKIVVVVDEEIPEEWTREAVLNMTMVF